MAQKGHGNAVNTYHAMCTMRNFFHFTFFDLFEPNMLSSSNKLQTLSW